MASYCRFILVSILGWPSLTYSLLRSIIKIRHTFKIGDYLRFSCQAARQWQSKNTNESVAGWTAETVLILIYMLVLNVKLMFISYKCTLLLGYKDQVFKRQSNDFLLQRLRSGHKAWALFAPVNFWIQTRQGDTMSIYIAWKLTCVYKTAENSLPLAWVHCFSL